MVAFEKLLNNLSSGRNGEVKDKVSAGSELNLKAKQT